MLIKLKRNLNKTSGKIKINNHKGIRSKVFNLEKTFGLDFGSDKGLKEIQHFCCLRNN